MSPISFSDQFMLLGLSGSQFLICRSSLGVDVDNTKPYDLFSTLYAPCIKTDNVLYDLHMFLMLQYNSTFETKFLCSDENLRIPNLLTLLSLCLFWDETWPRLCDLNLPFLNPRLFYARTRVWKPVSIKTLTPVCIKLMFYSHFH